MKTLLSTLALITLASSVSHAMAQENRGVTYPIRYFECDILRGADGGMVLGGPSYGIEIEDGEHVVLSVTRGADTAGPVSTYETPMALVSQAGEYSVYESKSEGIKAQIVESIAGPVLPPTITITTRVGHSPASAQCKQK